MRYKPDLQFQYVASMEASVGPYRLINCMCSGISLRKRLLNLLVNASPQLQTNLTYITTIRKCQRGEGKEK